MSETHVRHMYLNPFRAASQLNNNFTHRLTTAVTCVPLEVSFLLSFYTTAHLIRCAGVLLTCDAAVKQILLTLNEKQSFVIEDLDDFHLVIKADEEFRVRRQLETELEKNTYSLD
ncbi:hypothetical protein ACEPAG_9027 [Sanghuangporus baumii]